MTCLRAIAAGTPPAVAVTGMTGEQVVTLALFAVGLLRGNALLQTLLTAEQVNALAGMHDRPEDETEPEAVAAALAFLDGRLEAYELEALLDQQAEVSSDVR